MGGGWLITNGINTVIAVQDEFPDPPPGGVRDVICVWAPPPDMPVESPLLTWLTDTVAVAETLLRAGRKLYVHCVAGANRSPMVVALTMRLEGLSLDAAFWRVHAVRGISPYEPYMELLRRFEREIVRG